MRLVKFHRLPRGVLYVNPEHVISVTDEPEGNNAAAIRVATGGEQPMRYDVRGQADEVAAALASVAEAVDPPWLKLRGRAEADAA